ncbi:MAG TPA: uridine kinase [Bacteroidetes bacterium]|nr:uridine kinase [Bacteroidota bacterium]HDZ12037.1 uridine kinase [Bacteroidota bacterium]
MVKKRILIGIAGGSGSGKTLIAKNLFRDLGTDRVIIIQQDAYYKDLSHLSFEERVKQNFDHPDAIDSELLLQQLNGLLAGETIQQPIYDFTIHSRKKTTETIGGHDIIILEGILILDNPELRNLMDIKVYVDTDADIRLIRRLIRDTKERNRSMESVIKQYKESVRPMHLQFVEPSKRYADVIIPEGGMNYVAVDLLRTKIEVLLKELDED